MREAGVVLLGRAEADVLDAGPGVEGRGVGGLDRRGSIGPAPAQAASAAASRPSAAAASALEAGQDVPVQRPLGDAPHGRSRPRPARRAGGRASERAERIIRATPGSGPARRGPPAVMPDHPVARRLRLAAVPEHRLEQRPRPAVVQEARPPGHRLGQPDPPERRACATRCRSPAPRAGGRPAPRPCRAAAGRCRARSAGSSAPAGRAAARSRTSARGRRRSRPRRTAACRAAPRGSSRSRRAGTARLRL